MGQDAYVIFKTKPFDGYKLGREFQGKQMVAVPEKKMNEAKEIGKDICIFEKGAKAKDGKDAMLPPYMILDSSEIAQAFGEFEDKWGREGKYTLCYYEWKPIIQNTLF